jgi:signal transduction histidine kinase
LNDIILLKGSNHHSLCQSWLHLLSFDFKFFFPVGSMKTQLISTLINWGISVKDTPETKFKKSFLLLTSMITSICGMIWGYMYYVLYGFSRHAILPWSFAIIVGISIVVFIKKKNYLFLSTIYLCSILTITVATQLSLGGLVASGVVTFWTVMAPFGALIFQRKKAEIWLFAYLILITLSILLEDYATQWAVPVTPLIHKIFFAMNIIGPSVTIFFGMKYCVDAFYQEHRVVEAQAKELNQTLANLQRTQTQLVQAEKMSSLSQMVAGIAHEINNPVSFIYGNIDHAQAHSESILKILDLYSRVYPTPSPEIAEALEHLEIDFLREDLPKILASMKMGALRIREIVRSLRTFSRLDESEVKVVDIHEGLESALMILENRLRTDPDAAAIEIVRKYGQLPLVECYAGQLNQVFLSLLNNAIDALEEQKFTNTGVAPRQIILQTSLVIKETQDLWIRVTVIDNAQGMPPEVAAKIFDPFYTTKEVGKGTGLGLAVSYQIVVEKHRGTLECESNLGQGTKFVVSIPLRVTNSRE